MDPSRSASCAARVVMTARCARPANEVPPLIVENVLLRRRNCGDWACGLRVLVLRADPVLGRAQSYDDARPGCAPGGLSTEQAQGARADMDGLRTNFDPLEACHHHCGGRKVRRSRRLR